MATYMPVHFYFTLGVYFRRWAIYYLSLFLPRFSSFSLSSSILRQLYLLHILHPSINLLTSKLKQGHPVYKTQNVHNNNNNRLLLLLLPHLQRQHLRAPNPRLRLRPPQQRQCHRHHVQMLLPGQCHPLLRRLWPLLSRPRTKPGRSAGLSDRQRRAEQRCVLQ